MPELHVTVSVQRQGLAVRAFMRQRLCMSDQHINEITLPHQPIANEHASLATYIVAATWRGGVFVVH